jgi:hypothetical protein
MHIQIKKSILNPSVNNSMLELIGWIRIDLLVLVLLADIAQ